MARMIPKYNEYSEKELLQKEINQLKNELAEVKKEIKKFKDFMDTNASFTDFKRFKMVEEEESIETHLTPAQWGNRNPYENLPF
jgi:5-bromo-4-chloroindolyl phosphate hydrolysis protein